MKVILGLLLVVFLLQFSAGVKIIRVFCFEDHTKKTTKFITGEAGNNIGVELHERFHIVMEDFQVVGDIITIVDRDNWPSIIDDTMGNLKPLIAAALETFPGKVAPKIKASLTDKGLADAAKIIYEEGEEGVPESFRQHEVDVIDCSSKSVSFFSKAIEYTVNLRFKNPISSPDKLTISLIKDPLDNGIHADEAPEVKAQFGKEIVGLPVTFFDINKVELQRNWNTKMYFIGIPPLSLTKNQINEKILSHPASKFFVGEGKLSEPMVFRITVGGKDEVKGQQMDKPCVILKHMFSTDNQAGFLTA